MGGWLVGKLESNAKLNSKLRLKLKLELSLAICLQCLVNHELEHNYKSYILKHEYYTYVPIHVEQVLGTTNRISMLCYKNYYANWALMRHFNLYIKFQSQTIHVGA